MLKILFTIAYVANVTSLRKDLKEQSLMMICPGETWLGLENLHQLTSKSNYSLRITLKDFDEKIYVAVYDQFQVVMMLMLQRVPNYFAALCTCDDDDDNSGWSRRRVHANSGRIQHCEIHPQRLHGQRQRDDVHHQVRRGKTKMAFAQFGNMIALHYQVKGVNLIVICFKNIRDKDQDKLMGGSNCAKLRTGGWWYEWCGDAHLTGQHTVTELQNVTNIANISV